MRYVYLCNNIMICTNPYAYIVYGTSHAHIPAWDVDMCMGYSEIKYDYGAFLSHMRMGHLICAWGKVCIWSVTDARNLDFTKISS